MEEIIILKSINNSASIVSLRNDGIITIEIKADTTLKLADAKEMVKGFAEIGEEKKHLLLFIAGDFALANAEARNYASGEEANKYTIASAFVVRNIAQKLIG